MAGVELKRVSSRSDLRRFLYLPWNLYRNDPAWVPPLLVEVTKALDRSSHPFFRHAEAEFFLALREGRTVGRVAAIVNHRLNEFHRSRVGEFGLFEAADDVEVAWSLLATAAEWCRARGMEVLRGPMNFSTNEEVCSPGVLVEGFQHPPVIMTGHSPPYYAPLLEACGLRKARDLLCYRVEDRNIPPRLLRAAERLARAGGSVRVRPIAFRDLRAEVERIKEIYNASWERNWGFVPLTDEEIDLMARTLKAIVDPRFCLLAEVGGRPAGFALQLPDLNQAFRHMDGRWLPWGWAKFLWHRRHIRSARVLTLGVKPEFRHRGLDSLLVYRLFQEGLRAGYRWAECSWILEDNLPMRNALERIGAYVYKVYRVYEAPLASLLSAGGPVPPGSAVGPLVPRPPH